MNTAVDGAFIRRAFDLADLNAVKIALVQATGDPEVAALGPIAELSPDQRELLIAKAISFVQSDAVNLPAELPAEDELRRLMEMATGISMTDEEFEARRGIPGFEEHPWACHWANGKPELPEGVDGGSADSSHAIASDHTMIHKGQRIAAKIYDRAKLVPGNVVPGPAVVTEFDSTTVILPGYAAKVDKFFNLLINKA